jgi:cell division protein FtsI (penicillin-binding protein 3)
MQRRVGLLFALFLLLLGAAGARAAYLGAVKGESLKRAANVQQVSALPVPARRGTIFDRHGVELAVSQPAQDVSATPYLVRDPVRAARKIAPLLRKPEEDVLRLLARRDTGFVYLARQLPMDRADAIERMELPGLQFTPSARRVYPRAWLGSQILGSVGIDARGLAGIEYSSDDRLRGADGERRLVKDALGRPISIRDAKRARPGSDLRLTIDAEIQSKVEDVLAGVGTQYRPKGATAIVIDPRTAEVLAMANWPRVDANDLGGAPSYARQNRAVGSS